MNKIIKLILINGILLFISLQAIIKTFNHIGLCEAGIVTITVIVIIYLTNKFIK